MKRAAVILVFMLVLALSGPSALAAGSGYWPEGVDESQLRSVEWSLDFADLSDDDLPELSMVSVSPSGRYIVAADRITINKDASHAAGVANPLGRLPDMLYLFARDGEHYRLEKGIPIDTESQLELSSLVGGGSAFSWNEEETRAVITGDWGAGSSTMSYITNRHTNLYLLELESGSIRCLTQNIQAPEHCVLARWAGPGAVMYIRVRYDDLWHNELCGMDIETGQEQKLAELYSAEGRASAVLDWQIADGQIYYTLDPWQAGFYVSPLGGSEADARCLIDVQTDLWETGRHPYCRSWALCRLEISADGRWACIGINDPRIINRDIPFADDAQHPQSDPASAVSVISGQPWVPCHDVLLYDLQARQLVDPFRDAALSPKKVIVTGACFAPDGQSLLCAVFGDGGPWKTEDMTRTTFYQIRLTDGSFSAVKVFEAELAAENYFPKGIRWLGNNVLCIPTMQPPRDLVEMLLPAAFSQYPQA